MRNDEMIDPAGRRTWRCVIRRAGWGVAAALAVVAPKCGLCVLAWWAVLTGTGVEICGASAPNHGVARVAAAAVLLAWGIAALGARRVLTRRNMNKEGAQGRRDGCGVIFSSGSSR